MVTLYIKDYGVLTDDPKKHGIFAVNNIIGDIFEEGNYIYTEIDRVPVYVVSCKNNDAKTR